MREEAGIVMSAGNSIFGLGGHHRGVTLHLHRGRQKEMVFL